jgi:hypothetical protein
VILAVKHDHASEWPLNQRFPRRDADENGSYLSVGPGGLASATATHC